MSGQTQGAMLLAESLGVREDQTRVETAQAIRYAEPVFPATYVSGVVKSIRLNQCRQQLEQLKCANDDKK